MIKETSRTPKTVAASDKPTRHPSAGQAWPALENFHSEIDRLFDYFLRYRQQSPFMKRLESERRPRATWTCNIAPAIDIVETDDGYEITVELPGLDETNITVKVANGGLVKVANGGLMIRGEKKEGSEGIGQGRYLSNATMVRSNAGSAFRKM